MDFGWFCVAASWIGRNWSALGSVVFSAAVAWAAWEGVKLNRRLVNAELDPAVTVYVEPSRHYLSLFELIVKNSGRGAAKDISFVVDPDLPTRDGDIDSRLTRLVMFQQGISYLGPYQEIRTFFGTYRELVKQPITVVVAYYRASPTKPNQQVRSTFVLDIRHFEGVSQVGELPERSSANALKQIADDLRKIRQGGSWSTLTVTVKRHYFFSQRVNEIWYRWFGTPYLNSSFSTKQHFVEEFKRTFKESRASRFWRENYKTRNRDNTTS